MKFHIMCDYCHWIAYEIEVDTDKYIEMNDIRKAIYEHKCSDKCKMIMSIPKFPVEDHDYVL